MNVLTMFPSKYLKAADLEGKPHDVTITRCVVGTVGEGADEQERPILHFAELKKPLCLNVTNSKRIINLHGDDSDDWTGKRITIYPSECDFKAETVDCIRVKPNAPTSKARAAKPVVKKPAGKRP